jgi:uncharacterized protein (TIGR00255 family)
MIQSMTGFASARFESGGEAFKIEVKTLNHRFLDLKIRMPRDLAPLEQGVRTLIEAGIKRGSVDLWIERQGASKPETDAPWNESRIQRAYELLSGLREKFKIREELSVRDLLSFPEVLSKSQVPGEGDSGSLRVEADLGLALKDTLDSLIGMKQSEGLRLKNALLLILRDLELSRERLLHQREVIRGRARDKVRKRIELCFEAYPTGEEKLRSLIETRIAQEISHALEKLDIEEELTRFHGHVSAIRDLLEAGGQVGKRLDFLFQELNREINTLGNKSQDLEISKEVIDLKMKVEQMREQSLNLE